MKIFKSTVLVLLAALSLSSCLVAGPGYGYRGGHRGGYGHHGGGHYGGGGHHGGGHYRR